GAGRDATRVVLAHDAGPGVRRGQLLRVAPVLEEREVAGARCPQRSHVFDGAGAVAIVEQASPHMLRDLPERERPCPVEKVRVPMLHGATPSLGATMFP